MTNVEAVSVRDAASQGEDLHLVLDLDAVLSHLPDPSKAGELRALVRSLYSGTELDEQLRQAVSKGISLTIVLDGLDAAMMATLAKLSRPAFLGGARAKLPLLIHRYADATAAVHRVLTDIVLHEQAEEHAHHSDISNLRNLARAVGDVNEISIEIAHLSRNTRQATQGAQTIASAATELVSSIEEIAHASESTLTEAHATQKAAQAAASEVQDLSGTMASITDATVDVREKVIELEQAFDQIAQILNVIDTIASQTNLLALNATIEAARAGDAGRGFAVVASEVKELATQTASATENIGRRIESMRAVIGGMGAAMARSEEAVSAGGRAIATVTDSMTRISGMVDTVAQRMDAVHGVLAQQKLASEEIAANIDHNAVLAQDNEALLHRMADNLQASNDRFSENAKTWFNASSPEGLCEMAKIDHILFKKRVVDTLMGRTEWRSAEVPDHHGCRLGKWYDGIVLPGVRDLPAFRALVGPHERVHSAARKALGHHEAGRTGDAVEALGDLAQASREVLDLLDQLSRGFSEQATTERRRHERRKVNRLATVTSAEGKRNVVIEDLSESGARLRGVTSANVGQQIDLHHDSCSCTGTVVWSGENGSGLRFTSEAPPRQWLAQ